MEILRKDNIFYIGEENNMQAYIKFSFVEKNVISIDSTYVSPSLRGNGIAEILTKKVAELAEKKYYKIVPICSYAVNFFEKEKYKKLLKK